MGYQMNQTNGGGDGRYAHDSRQCGEGKRNRWGASSSSNKALLVVEGGEGTEDFVRCVVNAVVVGTNK